MNRYIKNTALVLSLLMTLLMLAACGSGGGSSSAAAPAAADSTAASTAESASEAAAEPAGDPITLKLGIAHAEGQPSVLACEKFAQDVNERTNGRITIEVFPGGVLGNETSMRDSVQTGGLQMASLGAGVMGAYTSAADLPVCNYVWDSEEQMMSVLNGDLGRQYIYDEVEKNGNMHVINGWPQSPRQLLTVKPVESLADLSGMKIRVPAGNAIYEETWSAMGALPVALAMDEVYTALEQGVIDGLEMPIDSLYNGGYQEKAKYLTLTNHMMYLQYLFINQDTWDSLSAEEQDIITECAGEAEQYHTQLRDESLEEIKKDMEAQGVTITEVDIAPFKEACDPVLQNHMDEWGQEVYDAFTGA